MKTLGIDFDGVLRKFPTPIRRFYNFLAPHDLLIRARLSIIRNTIRKLIEEKGPILLDGELINSLNTYYRETRKILISGRCTPQQRDKAISAITPYLNFAKFIFKGDCTEWEERFKERVLRAEEIDIFLEDRKFVRNYLRQVVKIPVFCPEAFLEELRTCRSD